MLKIGDKGTGVLELQTKLKTIGYMVIADGDFGPNTEYQVKLFQSHNHLKADGIVGPKTESTIKEIYLKHLKYESAGNDRTEGGVVVNRFNQSEPIFLLDPGHGGLVNGKYVTPGKRSPEIPPGIYEGVVNRQITKRLIDYCEDNQINYVNLVTENTDISLSERVRRANKVASIYPDSIYVSIHCNAAGNGWNSANGIETFYYKDMEAFRLAGKFQRELITETDARNRGVKEANFYVLRKTNMPAVLLELGFHTNLREAKLLASEDYQDKLAYAIAKAMKTINK